MLIGDSELPGSERKDSSDSQGQRQPQYQHLRWFPSSSAHTTARRGSEKSALTGVVIGEEPQLRECECLQWSVSRSTSCSTERQKSLFQSYSLYRQLWKDNPVSAQLRDMQKWERPIMSRQGYWEKTEQAKDLHFRPEESKADYKRCLELCRFSANCIDRIIWENYAACQVSTVALLWKDECLC